MRDSEVHDPHFVRAVLECGDARAMTTTHAVFSRTGLKLMEQGMRVDSRMFERLIAHKLVPDLEECLAVEHPITSEDLMKRAHALLAQTPLLGCFTAAPGGRPLLEFIRGVPLPAPVAFKLTVAADQRPEILDNSLTVAIVALHLGLAICLPVDKLRSLAAAGLLHDLGELHIDPSLFRAGHVMTPEERHHLYAHPLTSMLIAQQQKEYPSEVAIAIREHHERLDGSGYPRGLKAQRLGPLSRIMSLAEVVSAFLKAPTDAAVERLSLLLRLNHRQFDRVLTDHVIRALQGAVAKPAPVETLDFDFAQLERLSVAIADWSTQLAAMGSGPSDAAAYVGERMEALEHSLREAGVHPRQFSQLVVGIGNDAAAMRELGALARETTWQLYDILHEVNRRWADLHRDGAGSSGLPIAKWLGGIEALLH